MLGQVPSSNIGHGYRSQPRDRIAISITFASTLMGSMIGFDLLVKLLGLNLSFLVEQLKLILSMKLGFDLNTKPLKLLRVLPLTIFHSNDNG